MFITAHMIKLFINEFETYTFPHFPTYKCQLERDYEGTLAGLCEIKTPGVFMK